MDLKSVASSCRFDFRRADGALVRRAEVVAEARSWVGTPFCHQGHRKGEGADCAGLLRGVCAGLGLLPLNFEQLAPSEVRGYAETRTGTEMLELCTAFLQRIKIEDARAGDIAVMQWVGPPHHAGILAPYGSAPGMLSIVHALGPVEPRKVVEHRLDSRWRGRIVAAFHIPGVEP